MKKTMFDFDSKQEVREAFKAGNRARKKESVQDAVESFDSIQAQIDRFREQTGKELKIRDGRPYFDGTLDLEGCTGVTSLPASLKVNGYLSLENCTGLTSLPAGLEVEGKLDLTGCTGLTGLPDGLKVGGSLDLTNCTGLTSLPFDLIVQGYWIVHHGILIPFFRKLGIPVESDGDTKAEEWCEWQKAHGYLTEAFKAGNKARKKESAQDAVESFDNIQAQIDLFKKQTGIKLEIRDGRPYFDESLCLDDCIGLTNLPTGLKVNGCLYLSGCTGLTSLPDGLKVVGDLYLSGCTGLTSLSADLEVGVSLFLDGCTGLTSLPAGLSVGGILFLDGCTGLTSLPFDLVVQGDYIVHHGILMPFFRKLGIPVDRDGDTDTEDWREWQKAHGYLREAFRAGNRARKKESVVDTVESVDSMQAQIDQFKEQTGKELEIRDGRPYFDGRLWLSDCTGLISLPDRLEVGGSLDLRGCNRLTSLPTGLKIGGNLWIKSCTELASLPDGLKVGGSLNVRDCDKLTSLSTGLKIRGDLWIKDCTGLTRLPADLKVGGDLWLNGCTGLTSLPAGLKVNGCLSLKGCTRLTSLPAGLEVGGLSAENCTGLTSLPAGLKVKGKLYLQGCTGLTELPNNLKVGGGLNLIGCTGLTGLPFDLVVQGPWIVHHGILTQFFEKLGIPVDRAGDTKAVYWCEWQKTHGYLKEAFRAGNRARKKESVQDTVNSVYNIQEQIDQFKEQTGIELEIRNGRPYFSNDLYLGGCTELTNLPANMEVDGSLSAENCTRLTSLPTGLKVRGDLHLTNCTGLTSLPDNLEVEGYLTLAYCTGLTNLPAGLEVGGDLYLAGCTRLTNLPTDLKVGGGLWLKGCTGLTSLPDNLKVKETLNLAGCTGLTNLSAGLKVGKSLWLNDCTGLVSLPFDLVVQGSYIIHNGMLTPFFRKLRIPVDDEGNTEAKDWRKWQRAHGYLKEAFKAGNRARKKETAQDAVESVDSVQKQIDLFKKQTGVQLEIRDGKPYINSLTADNFKNPDTLTWLPDGLTLDYNLNLENFKKLKSLPSGLTVTKKSIILCNCTGLTSIAGNLSVKGCLDLWKCSGLKSLSANLTVGEDLYLSYCTGLKSLPTNMTVGGALYLEGCEGLTTLPADLTVGDYISQIPDSLIPFIKNLGIEIYKNTDEYWIEASDWMNKRHLVDRVTEAFKAGNKARKKEAVQDAQTDNIDTIDNLEDLLDVCDKVVLLYSGKEHQFPKGWVFGTDGSGVNPPEITESPINNRQYLKNWLVKYRYDFNGSRIRSDLAKELPGDENYKFDSDWDLIHSNGRATHLNFDYTVGVMKKKDEDGYRIIFNDGVNEACIYMPGYSRSSFGVTLMYLFGTTFMKRYVKAAYYQGVNDPLGDENYKEAVQMIIHLFTEPGSAMSAWKPEQVISVEIRQEPVYTNNDFTK